MHTARCIAVVLLKPASMQGYKVHPSITTTTFIKVERDWKKCRQNRSNHIQARCCWSSPLGPCRQQAKSIENHHLAWNDRCPHHPVYRHPHWKKHSVVRRFSIKFQCSRAVFNHHKDPISQPCMDDTAQTGERSWRPAPPTKELKCILSWQVTRTWHITKKAFK